MTNTIPTPIPPRPPSHPDLEHWIWLDPHRPLLKTPIAEDPRASAFDAALRETRLFDVHPASQGAERLVRERIARHAGPCLIVTLGGPRLAARDVQARLDLFLWHTEKHGWKCRVAAMDPDAGMLCIVPRPDGLQPGLAIAASTQKGWPRIHSLTLSVFPTSIQHGRRREIVASSGLLC